MIIHKAFYNFISSLYDWELRKLSEGTYIKSRIGWQRLTKDEYLFAGDYYLITGTDIDELTHSIDLSRSVYVSKERYEKDEKIQVKEGDIIITKDGTIGKVAMVQGLDKPATLNSHLFVLRDISGELDNRFLLHVLDSPLFTKFVEATKTGSTLTGLPQKTFVNFMYYLPSKEEQQRISELLDRLDAILALHQRKLDLLKQLKQAYLQKMFPKNGEKMPEMRFAHFKEEWTQYKLSELATHRGGTAIEKYFSDSGEYKVISIGSYGLDNKYVDQGIRAVSNKITNKRLVKKNELTMVLNDKTANGSIIGRCLIIDSNNRFVINQRTEIISPQENFDPSFAYTILNGPFRENIKKVVQGGTQIYINYSVVENLSLSVPSIKEQEKIGELFKQFDNIITLHQKKFRALKTIKEAFLSKFFI
ncbi:restriction endonuclease subunit S [Enterococcus avium]|uniref:restriction endonuclease subunit S n=1 Tax=Enterococcus avium TaxID=33945 RepID=UPI0032E4710F